MQNNNMFKFILFSCIFVGIWYLFFQPKQDAQQLMLQQQQQQQTVTQSQETNLQNTTISNEPVSKQDVIIEVIGG